MLIDCDSCAVRGAACQGAWSRALFDTPPRSRVSIAGRARAIEVFARAGFEVEVLSAAAGRPADGPSPRSGFRVA